MNPVIRKFARRPPKAAASGLALGALLVSACSHLGLGEEEYGCSGMPPGVRCLSAREVYHRADRESISAPATGATAPTPSSAFARPGKQDSRSPHPPASGEEPFRTAAQVMRIWIAPWEDARGDLQAPGYVWTEIEARRWQVARQDPGTESQVLKPLQTRPAAPPDSDESIHQENRP